MTQFWRVLPLLDNKEIGNSLLRWRFQAWSTNFVDNPNYNHKLQGWRRAGFPDYWSLEMWGTEVFLIDEHGMVRAKASGSTLSNPTSFTLSMTPTPMQFVEPTDRKVFLPKKLRARGKFNPLATLKAWGLKPLRAKVPDANWRAWQLPSGWSLQFWDHELRLVDHLGQQRGRWGFVYKEPRLDINCQFQWSSSFSLGDNGPFSEGFKDSKERIIYSIDDVYIPDDEVEQKLPLMQKRVDDYLAVHFPNWKDPLAYWELGTNEGRTDRWRSTVGMILTKEKVLAVFPVDAWIAMSALRLTLQERNYGKVLDGELYCLLSELKQQNLAEQGRQPFGGRMEVCYRRHKQQHNEKGGREVALPLTYQASLAGDFVCF